MARLEQVHCGASELPAIVFVHGLGGDLFDTWIGPGTSRDNCWLHWVGQDTGCDTWTLGYDAALSSWQDQAMPLPDQGTQVAQLLAVHAQIKGRSMVLVGHSMGGLVIKTLVVQTQAAGDARARDMLSRIRGIVFVATPHQGSQLATLARAIAAPLRTNSQVGDMSRHDAHLRHLGNAFREQQRALHLKVAAFVETRDVVWQSKRWFGLFSGPVGVRIVDPSSGDPALQGVTTVPLAEDHFSICKPSSRDAQIHHALTAFVKDDILARAPSAAAPNSDYVAQSMAHPLELQLPASSPVVPTGSTMSVAHTNHAQDGSRVALGNLSHDDQVVGGRILSLLTFGKPDGTFFSMFELFEHEVTLTNLARKGALGIDALERGRALIATRREELAKATNSTS